VLSFVLVLVVASLTRLPFPDLTPFGHDEALEAERARPIWYGARPVDSEITSWWIPDPAGLLYVFALAEPFPKPAIVRVLLVSALNVASVVLCYLFARRFFGQRVGLLAGLLYAVNPWAVTFGRQPWVITQPLLTTLMLFAAAMVIVKRDRRWVVPFFVAGAVQTQTHQLAVVLGPPVLLTLLFFARRWLVPQLIPAVVAGVAIVTPFALHLWELRDDIAEALSRGNRGMTLAPDGTAATLTAWLISGYNLDLKLGFPDAGMAALHWPSLVVAGVASVLLVIGVVVAGRACLRRQPCWEADALLLIWTLAPLALMTWQTSQVYIHYVLCLVPVPFVLIARAADWLAGPGESSSRGWTLRARIVGALIAMLAAVQVAAIVAFYAAIDRSVEAPPASISPTAWQARLNESDLKARQLGIGEIHGLPLRYWQNVADRTRDVARAAGVRDVVVVTGIQDDGARWLDKRRKALNYLLGPDLQPRFPLEGLVVWPTTESVLYLTIPDEELPRAVQRGATRLVNMPLPETNGATNVFQVRPRPVSDISLPRRALDVSLGQGVRLVGLDPPSQVRPGQTAPIVAFLLVDQAESGLSKSVVPRVEIVDGAGRVLVAATRGGLASSEWRTGDVLIQSLNLTVPVSTPPGDYNFRVRIVPSDDDAPTASETPVLPTPVLRVRAGP
jgi:4-amino-4-deoxy-L-arabinose transferase-like glycosyltransferase